MADKETKLRFNVSGIDAAKKKVEEFGKACDDAAKKAERAFAAPAGVSASSARWKNIIAADEARERARAREDSQKEAKKRWAKYDDPDFFPTAADLRRDRPPGWQDSLRELEAEHAQRVRRGGGVSGNYSHATWLRNRARSWSRGIFLGVGAAAGVGSLYGIGQVIEAAKRNAIAGGDLAKAYGMTGWDGALEGSFLKGTYGSYEGMGVSHTEALQHARTYTSLAGSRGGVGGLYGALRSSGAFARLTGIEPGVTAEHWGAMAHAGLVGGTNGMSETEYFSRLSQAVYQGNMTGREVELLGSLRSLAQEQLHLLANPSKAGLISAIDIMTSLNASAGAGMRGEAGMQFLSQISGGIQHPGGGGTGIYLLSKMLGTDNYYDLKKTMEEGAFGPSKNLAKVLPGLSGMFGGNLQSQSLFAQSMFGGELNKWEELLTHYNAKVAGGREITKKDIEDIINQVREETEGEKIRDSVQKLENTIQDLFAKLLPYVERVAYYVEAAVSKFMGWTAESYDRKPLPGVLTARPDIAGSTDYITEGLDKASEYHYKISDETRRRMAAELSYRTGINPKGWEGYIGKESAGWVDAENPKSKATGIFQIMPKNLDYYGPRLKRNSPITGRNDPRRFSLDVQMEMIEMIWRDIRGSSKSDDEALRRLRGFEGGKEETWDDMIWAAEHAPPAGGMRRPIPKPGEKHSSNEYHNHIYINGSPIPAIPNTGAGNASVFDIPIAIG